MTTPEQQPAQDALSAKGAARRRFTRAGLGASGVLLTLTSQPGMAQTVCASPSGSLSHGLQSHAAQGVVCQGLSPGIWKTHNVWPPGYTRDTVNKKGVVTGLGTLFTDSFLGFPSAAGGGNQAQGGGGDADQMTYDSPNCTFDLILSPQKFDQTKLGMHLAATMLNIQSGRINFLTVDRIRDMWNEVRDRGWFEPTANEQWLPDKIVEYLKNTMG